MTSLPIETIQHIPYSTIRESYLLKNRMSVLIYDFIINRDSSQYDNKSDYGYHIVSGSVTNS